MTAAQGAKRERWPVTFRSGPRLAGLQRLDAFQFSAAFCFYSIHFVSALQVQPELLGCSKESGEANCGICRDSTTLQNNVIDARGWNQQPFCQPVGRHSHRLQEFFPENLARVNSPGRCTFSGDAHCACGRPLLNLELLFTLADRTRFANGMGPT